MNKVIFSDKIQEFIDTYNKVDYEVWNQTKGIMVNVRSAIRNHYIIEQNYKCCYCRQQTLQNHGLVWDCEHILPKALFPAFLFEPYNLALSCKECNQAKEKYRTDLIKEPCINYSMDSNNYRIIHPHFDNYNDHIDVAYLDGLIIFNIAPNSEKGKFTYLSCNLFRFEKKLVGHSDINDNVCLTLHSLLESGMSCEDIVDGLLSLKIAIKSNSNF